MGEVSVRTEENVTWWVCNPIACSLTDEKAAQAHIGAPGEWVEKHTTVITNVVERFDPEADQR
ncbi:hypothetical protein [Nocardia africana]